jgi:hypothetical protein
MSFWSALLNDVGLGSATGSTGSGGYTFGEQNADFIKLQFLYAAKLKRHLANGDITQEYYDSHFWLTTQSLTPPYSAWWDEFRAAIESEDLNWLANQIGQSVGDVTEWFTRNIANVIVRGATGALNGIGQGLTTSFFNSMNAFGWLTLFGLTAAFVWGWRRGYVQKAFKVGSKAATHI